MSCHITALCTATLPLPHPPETQDWRRLICGGESGRGPKGDRRPARNITSASPSGLGGWGPNLEEGNASPHQSPPASLSHALNSPQECPGDEHCERKAVRVAVGSDSGARGQKRPRRTRLQARGWRSIASPADSSSGGRGLRRLSLSERLLVALMSLIQCRSRLDHL